MAETSQFGLPLLAAAQAQKHVTVNEALCMVDAIAQLRLTSTTVNMPPATFADGDAFAIPNGATGAWFGQGGMLGIATNGGWRFVPPKVGWQAFNVETGTNQLFDGIDWLESTLAATPNGSASEYEIVEVDHTLVVGSTATTQDIIPANAQVIGVTARVIQPITGTLTSWRLGVAAANDRYGQGLGLPLNSYALGMSGSPTTYYSDTPLVLTAEGGDFADGEVRIAAHFATLRPPRAV